MIILLALILFCLFVPHSFAGDEIFSITFDEVGDQTGFTALDAPGEGRWYDSEFWNGPEFARIGRHWMHPGSDKDVSRMFRVPRDGRIRLTGRVRKLHLDGDGVVATIQLDGRELWQATLDGKDDTGKEHVLEADVKAGESLRFRLNRRGNHSCDTTAWDPTIAYLDGDRQHYVAAEGFSGNQGKNHWFYELESAGLPPVPALNSRIDNDAYRELTGTMSRVPEFEMFPLVLAEWLQEDGFYRSFPDIRWEGFAAGWIRRPAGYEDSFVRLLEINRETLLRAAEEQLQRTAALIEHSSGADFSAEKEILANLRRDVSSKPTDIEAQKLYVRARLLKRSVFLGNPEFHPGEILFVKRRPPSYSHLVGQYFGWRQQPGGGLFILEKPGYSLKTRDLLGDQLPTGSILEPRLSYDGRSIAFSHVVPPAQPLNGNDIPVNEEGDGDHYYHLYEMNVDGGELRRLTDAAYDDMMPEYLPDGGLAFVSTRRQAYSRCFGNAFGRRWHSYTLHRMERDESGRLNSDDIRRISFNDVNEWFPATSNSGHLIFARWDYIDRDAVTHQNLWAMRPDGTNPVAVWGNAAPKPHCMFQAKAIPGGGKFVFIASAHHSITGGPVCVVDPAIDANSLDAVRKITPGGFPEADGWDTPEYYNSPFPFSEHLFLVAYSPARLVYEPKPNIDNALGLYLLDDRGNREVLYRDADIGSTCPQPIAARPVPPTIPSRIDARLAAEGLGEMSITDVYEGLGDVKPGTLKELRIVQIFPKTTWIVNQPRIGAAGEENTRAILGVVPIEPDGSAKFLVPSGKPFLFQVLDENGFAYQTMRSTTSVMPGERVSCVGCHEDRMSAASRPKSFPIAFSKAAERIRPTLESGRPFCFVETVQPILDAKCISCHGGVDEMGKVDLSGKLDLTREAEGEFTRSYHSLCSKTEWNDWRRKGGGDPTRLLVPRFAERNQIQQTAPGGMHGARGSRLIRLLADGHENVKLTQEELRRIGTWIDMNAVFYGAYDPALTQRQLHGEPIPMPCFE